MSPERHPAGKKAPLDQAQLPHLAAFLSGYLHEDFLLDHDTPEQALAEFLAASTLAERRRLARDWRMFKASMEDRPWPAVRHALAGVGGAWRPPSRAALDRLFSVLDGL